MLSKQFQNHNEDTVNNNIEFQKANYAIYTNLGWANLGLKNYSEAKVLLNRAITIYQNYLDKLDQSKDKNERYERKGKAYCLLAQVAEDQNNKIEALQYWQNCIQYANRRYPEEYIWVNLANEKVK